MNKLLIPLVILLGSLLYSLFWNTDYRRPKCKDMEFKSCCGGDKDAVLPVDDLLPPPPVEKDTTQENLTPVERTLFTPLDVYFQSGSAGIIRTEEIDSWLAMAKQYLSENPSEKLVLTGHTDSDGPDALNQTLSESRAGKVKQILVSEGFTAGNLVTEGKGETEPIGDNATVEGKQKNRRVSIRLIK